MCCCITSVVRCLYTCVRKANATSKSVQSQRHLNCFLARVSEHFRAAAVDRPKKELRFSSHWHHAGMMRGTMSSLASSTHINLSISAVRPCQYSFPHWPAQRQRICLMRKRVELARQGFRLLELKSHSRSHVVLAACVDAYRQQGQVRSTSSQPWQHKKSVERELAERSRAKKTSRHNFNSNSNRPEFDQRVAFYAPASAAAAPNAPDIAQARAYPAGAAQPSGEQARISVIDEHTQRAATATQPAQAHEVAEHTALQQDNPDVASTDCLSSFKVKTPAFWFVKASRCLLYLPVLCAALHQVVCCSGVHSQHELWHNISCQIGSYLLQQLTASDCRLSQAQKTSFKMPQQQQRTLHPLQLTYALLTVWRKQGGLSSCYVLPTETTTGFLPVILRSGLVLVKAYPLDHILHQCKNNFAYLT